MGCWSASQPYLPTPSADGCISTATAKDATTREVPWQQPRTARCSAQILYRADPDGLVRALARQRVPFTNLQIERASLEEAILRLTGGTS
jgi:hypothetical protein